MKKPRIVLAGTGSGVGKTSVSAGIMAALTGNTPFLTEFYLTVKNTKAEARLENLFKVAYNTQIKG